ncbi:hypothetical protein CYMTET_55667 [Cymbomonas tetramitiformis]|uniref:Uncharacterized protein n=1 Tax=Cymbomonas tetramitiformis TaxID=36881 RepID=A0AAE0BE79_9CHLO|nr:hypothetical protein CYMTET_55667 [Cymbomonas tetramitiformis]
MKMNAPKRCLLGIVCLLTVIPAAAVSGWNDWNIYFKLPNGLTVSNVTAGGLNWGGTMYLESPTLVRTNLFDSDGDVLFKLRSETLSEDSDSDAGQYCVIDSALNYIQITPLPQINEIHGLACSLERLDNGTEPWTFSVKTNLTHVENCNCPLAEKVTVVERAARTCCRSAQLA